jgi:hypothetical protein
MAQAVRVYVGRALMGDQRVPPWLNQWTVEALARVQDFLDGPASQYFNRKGLFTGGRKLYVRRMQEATEVYRQICLKEAEVRRQICLEETNRFRLYAEHEPLIVVEPEGWMLMKGVSG